MKVLLFVLCSAIGEAVLLRVGRLTQEQRFMFFRCICTPQVVCTESQLARPSP